MDDEFRTIRSRAREETKVEGSRFVATAVPVRDRAQAREAVEALRKEHHDATHNSFAFRLRGGEFRASDDGEPAGSAGKAILGAIDHAALTDTLVVVTRYFGGTKLGVGGLRRAYGGAAAAVLRGAEQVTVFETEIITCAVPHALLGALIQCAGRHGGNVRETRFDEEAHVTLEVRKSSAEALRGALVERTAGAVRFAGPGI